MIIYRHTLFKGLYDIRSYELANCIKLKQDLLCVLEVDGKIIGKMNVPYKKLLQKRWIKNIQKDIPSKINIGDYYDLLSVEWKPEKEDNDIKKYFL